MFENGTSSDVDGVSFISSDDIELLEHQVAGHGVDGSGVLKHKRGYVLKPNQDRGRGARELQFYQEVYNSNNNGNLDLEVRNLLQELTPQFLGVASMKTTTNIGENQCQEFLMLEDVVRKYKKPCIIDIKIGAQTWNPTHSIEKIKKESAKYIGTRGPLGISVAGMYYYDLDLKEYVRKEKDFGKSLISSTLYEGLKKFLNFKNENSKYITTKILEKLKTVEKLFLLQKKYAFYASSLLIAYDAVLLEEEDNDNPIGIGKMDTMDNHVGVYMIDFAHVFPLEKYPDANYLFGLRSVIQLFSAVSVGKHDFVREEDKL